MSVNEFMSRYWMLAPCLAALATAAAGGCGQEDQIGTMQRAESTYDQDVGFVHAPAMVRTNGAPTQCLKSNLSAGTTEVVNCPVFQSSTDPDLYTEVIAAHPNLIWDFIIAEIDYLGGDWRVYTYMIRRHGTDQCLMAPGAAPQNIVLASCPSLCKSPNGNPLYVAEQRPWTV